jgi:hypothetical protein
VRLTTEAELADLFQLSAERAAELRRANSWPHVRLGRSDVRYTDAQIEQIVAMQSSAPRRAAVVPDPLATVAPIKGQTQRSARRSTAGT